METVNQRHRRVLRCIVHNYIDTAAPVGSESLVKKYRFNCSAATVRNDMAELERRGYVTHPHTSAGRVPTDRGYRLFVDTLMRSQELPPETREQIQRKIDSTEGDMNKLLVEASQLLGNVSQELGVVLTPWLTWGIFDRLELIALSETKILVVVHVRSRLVKTVVVETNGSWKQPDLDKTMNILNERLSGLTLEEIRESMADRIPYEMTTNGLMQQLIEKTAELFDFSEPLEIHTCGTQNVLMQPEFEDSETMERILSLIDNRVKMIQIFADKGDCTQVTIGCENADEQMESFTVISRVYRRGNDLGTLGIIGPTRMHYHKIVPLVEYISKTITDYLS